MSLMSMIGETLVEAHVERMREFEKLVQRNLAEDEELGGFEMGETRVHFLIRILPFVPDVLTMPRHFAIAVTDRRLLIVRMKRNMWLNFTGSKVVASLPFDQIGEITPEREAVVVKTRGGRRYRYGNMDPMAPHVLRELVESARSAAA